MTTAQRRVDPLGDLEWRLGSRELIDPRETRDVLLVRPQRGPYRRQAAAEPVSRTAIVA